jgi:hypothetical protein
VAFGLVGGCGDEPASGGAAGLQVVEVGSAKVALPDCPAPWKPAGRDHLAYIGRTLETFVCARAHRAPDVLAVDADTGAVVDRAALKGADLQALRDGSRLHHTLRDSLAGVGSDDLVDVVIWFRVETLDLPDGEAQREDPEVGAWVHQVKEDGMRATVLELAAELERLPGTELRANLDAQEIGIPAVFARVPRRHLETLGELPQVNLIMPGSLDEEPVPQSDPENYFHSDVAWAHHFLGYTGNGIKVAVYEGARPDSYHNLPGVVPGLCEAEGGSASCHCPEGHMTEHPRGVAGPIRASVTSFGGLAAGSTTVFANFAGGCTPFGLDQYASALNWATGTGASVINISNIPPPDQAQHWMFWDYKAAKWPWPTMATAVGNGALVDPVVVNRMRNGLVVGAASDRDLDYSQDTRHDAMMYVTSRWENVAGWGELPHLVAPGAGVATAGYNPGIMITRSGTSIASPQVAAAAACIQEQNPALKMRPDAIISGLMVGADINADAATGGVWPLDLHDAIDDRDGTGLMNMYAAGWTLDPPSKRSPLEPASAVGHDYNTMFSANTPAGHCHHLGHWNVSVPPGTTLRAHSMLMSDPNCDASSTLSCTGNPYPESALQLLDAADQVVTSSARVDQNWQYLSITNGGSQDEAYKLQLCMTEWNGIHSRYFAVSWFAGEPMP